MNQTTTQDEPTADEEHLIEETVAELLSLDESWDETSAREEAERMYHEEKNRALPPVNPTARLGGASPYRPGIQKMSDGTCYAVFSNGRQRKLMKCTPDGQPLPKDARNKRR